VRKTVIHIFLWVHNDENDLLPLQCLNIEITIPSHVKEIKRGTPHSSSAPAKDAEDPALPGRELFSL
jgi:hypothetical protein